MRHKRPTRVALKRRADRLARRLAELETAASADAARWRHGLRCIMRARTLRRAKQVARDALYPTRRPTRWHR